MGRIVGIDLGTTKSVISVFEGDEAIVLTATNGKHAIPSFIGIKTNKDGGKEFIVGQNAKNRAVIDPSNTFYEVKRLIGRRFDDPAVAKVRAGVSYEIVPSPASPGHSGGDAWVMVDGVATPPAAISAKVLMELKAMAEKKLGEEVTEAIITVPAYFNDAQKEATKNAAEIAGLKVLRLIPEPTAAALAFSMSKEGKGKDGTYAIFDLGGGTFDISIVEIAGDVVEVKSINGDTFLGGGNFDERLLDYMVKKVNEAVGYDAIDNHDKDSRAKNKETFQRLRSKAEEVKIILSNETQTEISVPALQVVGADGKSEVINFEVESFTREELNALVKDLADKTIPPFKQALADAGLKISDLTDVLMVGAQTQMPLIMDTVEAFIGKRPNNSLIPDKVVAQGAGCLAGTLGGQTEGKLLLDVIPLSIGVRLADGSMETIVAKNSTFPVQKTVEGFSTSADMQENVSVRVFQGERAVADQNRLLGEFSLEIPPAPAGTPKIALTFSIDANGLLEVTATDMITQKAKTGQMKANGGLSEAQIADMLKDAEKNAAADAALREARAAAAEAEFALKSAAEDEKKEWFVAAPQELKDQFAKTITELKEAKAANNSAAVTEKAKAIKEVKLAMGKAFNDASAAAATPAAPAAGTPANEDTPAVVVPPVTGTGGGPSAPAA